MEKLIENNFKRQEFKFTLDKKSFLSLAKDKKLRKIYPTRTVNSIYFDTINFNFFHDSEEGTVPRKKVRVRYYDLDYNNISIENKFSKNYYRSKFSKKINFDDLSNSLVNKYSNSVSLIPTVKISYIRNYYISELGRITLDSNIKCCRANFLIRSIIDNKVLKNKILKSKLVLELKTNNNCTKKKAIQFLGIRDIRVSKYSEAMKQLYFVY